MAYVRKETKLHLVHLMLLTHSSPCLLYTSEILDSLRLENPPAKIFVDNDKQLYFATYTNEFCRYDQARGKIYSYPLNKEDGRVCDMSDVGDRLYVVHTSGVVEGIDKASGEPDVYKRQILNCKVKPKSLFCTTSPSINNSTPWLLILPMLRTVDL